MIVLGKTQSDRTCYVSPKIPEISAPSLLTVLCLLFFQCLASEQRILARIRKILRDKRLNGTKNVSRLDERASAPDRVAGCRPQTLAHPGPESMYKSSLAINVLIHSSPVAPDDDGEEQKTKYIQRSAALSNS